MLSHYTQIVCIVWRFLGAAYAAAAMLIWRIQSKERMGAQQQTDGFSCKKRDVLPAFSPSIARTGPSRGSLAQNTDLTLGPALFCCSRASLRRRTPAAAAATGCKATPTGTPPPSCEWRFATANAPLCDPPCIRKTTAKPFELYGRFAFHISCAHEKRPPIDRGMKK